MALKFLSAEVELLIIEWSRKHSFDIIEHLGVHLSSLFGEQNFTISGGKEHEGGWEFRIHSAGWPQPFECVLQSGEQHGQFFYDKRPPDRQDQ